MSMVKIQQYVLAGEVETLRLISQNNVYSAWFDCDFGRCELGVFSAAMPVEALHAVEGGICKDAATILFDGDLKDANCRCLNILIRRFCSMDKQGIVWRPPCNCRQKFCLHLWVDRRCRPRLLSGGKLWLPCHLSIFVPLPSALRD
jgi:hypothetical protein